jgi:hypothetical protein
MKQADEGFPSHKELITFMEQKCQVLETLKPSTNIVNAEETQGGKQQRRSSRDSNTFVAVTASKCVLCYKSHYLYECTVFLSVDDMPQRKSWVQKHKVCYNCVRQGHTASTYRSGHCRKCRKKHHTLIH